MICVGLIVQHYVVAGRNAQDVVDTGASQEDCQVLDIVLVCHHVVGVAAVAAHGDTRHLGHEMVLKACSYYLTAVVEVLRSDETYYCVHHEGVELPGKGVAAAFHCHLVGAVVGVGGELAALAGLKVHNVRPLGGALLFKEGLCLPHCVGIEAEGTVALLAACYGLEYHVAGGTPLHCLDLSGYMAQYADLGWNLEPVLYLIKPLQDTGQAGYSVVNRIQAKEGVAAAIGEPLEEGGGDAVHVVGGVPRLPMVVLQVAVTRTLLAP